MSPSSPTLPPTGAGQHRAHAWSALAPALRCPVCGEAPRLEGPALACERGHSFDLARAGYVNLLPTQRSAAHRPGDAPEMLRARERLLERGAYQPLADAVAEVVAGFLAGYSGRELAGSPRAAGEGGQSQSTPLVVDVGCGTGYYLARVAARLREAGIATEARPVRLLGIDAASDAARMTARRLAGIGGIEGGAVVADLWRGLPLRDGVADVLLDIFAPREPAEFARVLAPGGLLVILLPRSEHLREVRSLVPLLRVEEAKEEHTLARLASAFLVLARQTIDVSVTLDGPALRDLVAMTPSARHLDVAQLTALETRGPTAVTLACTLLTLERRDTPSGPDATFRGTMQDSART